MPTSDGFRPESSQSCIDIFPKYIAILNIRWLRPSGVSLDVGMLSFSSVVRLLLPTWPMPSTYCRQTRRKSRTVGAGILQSIDLRISSSSALMSSIASFRWAIFSKTIFIFKGYMSSYLLAMNIVVTPIICKSLISFVSYLPLKQRSRSDTDIKKVWSSHLKLVKTSIIQSIILARKAGVILCLIRLSLVRFYFSSSRKQVIIDSPYSSRTLMF